MVKPGDKIIITKNEPSASNLKKGDIETVREIDGSRIVRTETNWLVMKRDYKPYKQKKIKPGAYVIFKKTSEGLPASVKIGDIGKIIIREETETKVLYKVKWLEHEENRGHSWVMAENIREVKIKEKV